MFKFSGKRPDNLGVKDGRFTAPASWKPNWVSSQIDAADPHYIAPLKFTGDAKTAMARLVKLVQGQLRAKILRSDERYLNAEFSTPLMGYTDDVEFSCDGQAIHARSSSRLGIRDFDVNRKRVEKIRASFNA